jgi:hypothetical protein
MGEEQSFALKRSFGVCGFVLVIGSLANGSGRNRFGSGRKIEHVHDAVAIQISLAYKSRLT